MSNKTLILKSMLSLRKNNYQRTLIFHGRHHVRNASTVNQSMKLEEAKPFMEMPHPPMVPFVGSAWLYLPIIGRYSLTKQHLASRHKRQLYGDVLREKFGPLSIVLSFSPDDLETVYRNEGPYPARGVFTCIKAYRESRKQWYKSPGLLILEGKEWHDLRSKTQKHLMKPKAILAYLDPMQNVAGDLVKRISDIRNSSNEVPDLLGELYKWAVESVAIVSLDTRLGCLDKDLSPDSDGMKMIQSVQTMFHLMTVLEGFLGNIQFWKLFPTPSWRQFERASDEFSKIAFKYINRASENLKKSGQTDEKDLSLLQAMLSTEGLEIAGTMVTMVDMFFGGIDTTSHTVGFLLYELAKNPKKQELLHQEISKHLPTREHRITPEIFAELRYLKSCIKETLRLHPIIPVGARQVKEDVVISGYRVPAKTLVVVILQEICLDERYFKNAKQFIPERWLDKNEKPHPFAYLPFGFGPRSCIGRRLAELEMMCLSSKIIQNFKVEYHHEDIDIITKFVNTPDKPLRFNFIDRK